MLADFIIGKEVRDRPGQRYVRVPGQKRTYGVNVKVDLSTRFADWIETNLLKLDASRIRSVTFDNHKVDPERGVIIPGDVAHDRPQGRLRALDHRRARSPPARSSNTEKLSTL